jgi:NADH dehydrogenase/NADH:ubiquinone oxidoreductase subunit G
MPTVIIDNHPVDVTPGSNLLAAARKLGLDVPALCYMPGCEPNTACMACVMKRVDTEQIIPACATPAVDGLAVESETEEVRSLRRAALELMLSDHPGVTRDAATGVLRCDCDERDNCRLRKYAIAYDADPDRFAGPPRAEQRRYGHPQITYDSSKCILCGICVQLAAQLGEPLGLTVVGRGFEMRVDTPLGESLDAALTVAARRCAGACPTGALRAFDSAAPRG